MNDYDDGFFHYDDSYPPLCVQPPDHQKQDYNDSMEGVIISYLQESYKDGLKDPDTILPSGLSAGEAAVLYFRNINDKRKRTSFNNIDISYIIIQLANGIHRHMDIDVFENKSIFDKHINQNLFITKQYKRKLLPALKAYLKDSNLKTKGYTRKLKLVLGELKYRVN